MAGPSGLDIRRRSVGIAGGCWFAGLGDCQASIFIDHIENRQHATKTKTKNRRTILGSESMVDSESSLII